MREGSSLRTTGWLLVATTALGLGAPGGAAGRPVLCPADLGATAVDVSRYPEEHRRTYAELLVTKCAICHAPARALNAPFLELGGAELERFRAEHPAELATREVLDAAPDAWKRYITRMWRRPPCCALCPTFTKDEAARVWRFLVYDSRARKTGGRLPGWIAYRKGLIEAFHRLEHDTRKEDSP